MSYKLGKRPARVGAAKLNLRDYIDLRKLPTPPDNYGYETLVQNWGMLGNDTVGDCAIAGPMHAMQLWNAETKRHFDATTESTLAEYSRITGYDPHRTEPNGFNPTDRGSDVITVAEHWRREGLKDAHGKRHAIAAYVALTPGNVDELWAAMYLFDAVGIGVLLPSEWMEANQRGQVWDAVPNAHIEGGHYILGVGRRNGLINVVTWGATQLLTPAGYEAYNDEALAYLSHEQFLNGKDLDGFRFEDLRRDLFALGGGALSDPEPEPEPEPKPRKRKAQEAGEAEAKE